MPGPGGGADGSDARPASLSKLLLRHGHRFDDGSAWTDRHRRWLSSITLQWPAAQATLLDCRGAIEAICLRRDSLEREIISLLPSSPWGVQVGRLRCLRGIDTLTAFGLCAAVSVALRYVPASRLLGAANANVELKPSDASGNPYLVIAAGLSGIEDGLSLPDPIAADPAVGPTRTASAPAWVRLPTTAAEQSAALSGSRRIRKALGERLLGAFLAVAPTQPCPVSDFATTRTTAGGCATPPARPVCSRRSRRRLIALHLSEEPRRSLASLAHETRGLAAFDGGITAYTAIVQQQGDSASGGTIDDYNSAPSVFETDGVTPTESITCEGTTPSDGINCNTGAQGAQLTDGFFAEGSVDPRRGVLQAPPAERQGQGDHQAGDVGDPEGNGPADRHRLHGRAGRPVHPRQHQGS